MRNVQSIAVLECGAYTTYTEVARNKSVRRFCRTICELLMAAEEVKTDGVDKPPRDLVYCETLFKWQARLMVIPLKVV
jgi:hypothetical protein